MSTFHSSEDGIEKLSRNISVDVAVGSVTVFVKRDKKVSVVACVGLLAFIPYWLCVVTDSSGFLQ